MGFPSPCPAMASVGAFSQVLAQSLSSIPLSESVLDSLTLTSAPYPQLWSLAQHPLYLALLSHHTLLSLHSWLLTEMGASGSASQSCSAEQHSTALGEAVNARAASEACPLSTFWEEGKGGARVVPQEIHLRVQPCEFSQSG